MKLNLKPFLLLSSVFTIGIASADEVYFDTISTKKASREHGAYFGAFGGGSSNQSATFRGKKEDLGITDQDGWFLGAEFGYTVGTPLPVDVFAEIEFTYLNSPLDAEGDISIFKSDLRSLNLMMNFGVQLNLDDKRDQVGDFWANFRPYAGAGFGGAVVRQNNIFYEKDGRTVNSGDDSEFSWAYQVFAGVEFALSDVWSIYGEYKHLGYADIGGGEIADPEFDLWALGVKIKY